MVTLVIHAPKRTAQLEQNRSFDQTIKLQVGKGYAISKSLFEQLSPGCRVVILSKDEKRRAEAILDKLVEADMTKSHMQRYDVYFTDWHEVPYQPEALNRNGIAVY